ncbi:MAG TPA: Gfo/Idh/MocA family oxidoreductase [Chthonomonadaceae bacterium]|nr:Gfo/Idh/MocA family oxidoreductase [Chthonomonadaceae bacterium]
MPKTLGVAVHGAGWVSGEHIRAYQNNPHTQVVAISSRTRESAEARARETNATDAAIYTDYADVLADPRVDIVSLCTPPNLHPQETIAAAEAGKHILIEKSVANDLGSLRAMRAAVKKAGVRTVVSFVVRWLPQIHWINRMLDEGTLGPLYYGEVDYWHNIGPQYKQYAWNVKQEVAGSAFLSAGIHAVDTLRLFSRDTVVEVMAYSNKRNPEYEYDTNIVGILKFASGMIGKVSCSFDFQAPYVYNIDLLGEKGVIRDNRIYARDFFGGQTGWISVPTITADSGDVTHHPFQAQMDHLVDCILSERESFINLEEGAKSHEVCYALDRSAATGQPVRLPL